MAAIMINTRYDTIKKFHNATGNVAVDMVSPPSSQYPGAIGIYIRRGTSDFTVGQNITYENNKLVVSGPVQSVEDLPGQSFLVYVIPYSGSDITSVITGGFAYESAPGSSGSLGNSGSSAIIPASESSGIKSLTADNLKKYAPFIIIGLVLVGAVIYKIKKGKK